MPAVAHAAWWGTAWLRGLADTPAVELALAAFSPVHTVESSPGGPSPAAGNGVEQLLLSLGRGGATGLGIALPVEGDLLGLGGPPSLNAAALDAGAALLSYPADVAAVPWTVGAGTTWTLYEANRRQVPDVGEADRALRLAVLECGRRLAELDVASWSPDTVDAFDDLRRPFEVDAPPGIPSECVGLAARGTQMEALVHTALADHGGAVSAAEIRARRDVLDALSRHARRALVAACSPEAWPDR